MSLPSSVTLPWSPTLGAERWAPSRQEGEGPCFNIPAGRSPHLWRPDSWCSLSQHPTQEGWAGRCTLSSRAGGSNLTSIQD